MLKLRLSPSMKLCMSLSLGLSLKLSLRFFVNTNPVVLVGLDNDKFDFSPQAAPSVWNLLPQVAMLSVCPQYEPC